MAMQWGAFGQAPVQMVFRTFSDGSGSGSGSGSSLHTFLRRNENEVQVRFRSSLRGLDHRICIRARCWPSIDMNFYQGHPWRNIQFLYRYQSLTLYFRSNVNTLEHLVILEHVKDKVVRHQPVHNPRIARHQYPPSLALEPPLDGAGASASSVIAQTIASRRSGLPSLRRSKLEWKANICLSSSLNSPT